MTLAQRMDRTLYSAYEDNWDNKRFRDLLEGRIEPPFALLDFGAGRGALAEMSFKGRVKRAAGVDPDAAILDNPFLDEAKVLLLPSGEIPFPPESFDLVFANNVMEHLAEPEAAFKEIFRVLKPGGLFMAKTPNKMHYVPLVARLTPHSFHVLFNKLRGRARRDTFHTFYRCNSPGQVRRLARGTGFSIIDLTLWEGRPEYLRIAAPLYVLGYVYERIVNMSRLFSSFRCVIVFTLQKPPRC